MGQTVRNSATPECPAKPLLAAASPRAETAGQVDGASRQIGDNHRICGANHACKTVRHGPRCLDTDHDRGSAVGPWTIGFSISNYSNRKVGMSLLRVGPVIHFVFSVLSRPLFFSSSATARRH
ncbi:hypothetical protein LA080_004744 [Diaporthe eres]|nr:hypothetical protein LA080_004744 [Diaporthe eres]